MKNKWKIEVYLFKKKNYFLKIQLCKRTENLSTFFASLFLI